MAVFENYFDMLHGHYRFVTNIKLYNVWLFKPLSHTYIKKEG